MQGSTITTDFWRSPDSNTFVYYSFDDQWINWYITDESWNWLNATWWTQPTYVQVLWTNYAWNFYDPASWNAPQSNITWLSSTKFTHIVRVKVLAEWQQYISYIWWNYQQALIYWYNNRQIELYSYQWNTYRTTIKSSTNLNQRYCVWFTRNWTTMKTYLNWEYVWTITMPAPSITYLNVGSSWWSWRFHWQIWSLLLENNVERTELEFSNYRNKTKKLYWLS